MPTCSMRMAFEVNVMYSIDDPKKRAVGFKLSEAMEVPKELDGKFKFAPAEAQARRNDPGLILRDQRRVLDQTTQSRARARGDLVGWLRYARCSRPSVRRTI